MRCRADPRQQLPCPAAPRPFLIPLHPPCPLAVRLAPCPQRTFGAVPTCSTRARRPLLSHFPCRCPRCALRLHTQPPHNSPLSLHPPHAHPAPVPIASPLASLASPPFPVHLHEASQPAGRLRAACDTPAPPPRLQCECARCRWAHCATGVAGRAPTPAHLTAIPPPRRSTAPRCGPAPPRPLPHPQPSVLPPPADTHTRATGAHTRSRTPSSSGPP